MSEQRQLHVRPAEDKRKSTEHGRLLVRDPERGGNLPPEGRRVPLTTYWRRRLAAGDVEPIVELVDEPKIAAEPEAKKVTTNPKSKKR